MRIIPVSSFSRSVLALHTLLRCLSPFSSAPFYGGVVAIIDKYVTATSILHDLQGNTGITERQRSETSDAILKMTTAKYIEKMREEAAASAAAAEDEEDSDDVQLIPSCETGRHGGKNSTSKSAARDEDEEEEEEEDLPLRQRSKLSARASRHVALLQTSSSEDSEPGTTIRSRKRLRRASSASASSSCSFSSESDDSFLTGPSVKRSDIHSSTAADSDSDKSCYIVP